MGCENPCELTGAVLSMLTFVCDIVTDILVAFFYFYHGHYNWGFLTLVLIIVLGSQQGHFLTVLKSALFEPYVSSRLDCFILFVVLAKRGC